MQSINFDDGYKEFAINGDESRVIRFNPCDMGILERIKKAYEEIEKAEEESKDIELKPDGTVKDDLEESVKALEVFKNVINTQIDYIFNSAVAEIAFNGQSPLSLVGGVPLYERFLNAILPIIEKDVKKEMKASQRRISKYTDVVK
ncbi:hypothetical protein [Anaerosacchariphilus polymeriproducens]|uniref:Uncharacterized protein n=1 Tax=Anaerosacchariphilus polymeriproducens TaxID=1812858 RepID=A0A371AR79_9FIRM|nr:hypothetical protein [Anaerosacchariphilus polymeriproducens]RDU21940.1 hypothetical protein DWV06_15495 [Anaerosacchariphilus polymeriproducens]